MSKDSKNEKEVKEEKVIKKTEPKKEKKKKRPKARKIRKITIEDFIESNGCGTGGNAGFKYHVSNKKEIKEGLLSRKLKKEWEEEMKSFLNKPIKN